MRNKAFYEAPESEALDLGLETDLLTVSPTGSAYGKQGKAGANLDEMDELEF